MRNKNIPLLIFFCTTAFCGQTEIVVIPSPSMRSAFQATIVLPELYGKQAYRYSVIYCLHGYSGDYKTWPSVVPLDRYADMYQVIFVCPDGNYNSWYLDSKTRKESRFETYIAVEVPHWVDSAYKTHASYKGRGLIGTSMGGHGALTLLARHSDRFAAGASISGIQDLTQFPSEWDIASVLGKFTNNSGDWRRHSFLYLLDSLKTNSRLVILDCGTSDFALPVNRAAHLRLKELRIEHHYFEEPGDHSFRYLKERAEKHIRLITAILEKPLLK